MLVIAIENVGLSEIRKKNPFDLPQNSAESQSSVSESI